MNQRKTWTKIDWLILISVTLVAAALRLYKLGEVPPGFQFDEAFNAIDVQQVLEGNRPLFLPANAGREVLYTYWQALVILVYGFFSGGDAPVNVYTVRLASSLGGITAIPLIYTFLRRSLKNHARLIATGVAVAQTISMWHIHFSHFGIRVVLMPVMFTLAFGLYWVASSQQNRSRQMFYYILAGIATGLTVWNHPTGRFAPFVLITYVGWIWFSANNNKSSVVVRRSAISGLLVTGVVAFLVFLPLGLEFLERPDFFFSHAADSSFLNERVSQGAPARTLLMNIGKVVGMFSISGDRDWTHNLPGRPVYDPLMSVAFLIGLFLWLKRIGDRQDPDRNLLAMLFIWLLVMLLPSILSNDAPDYSRTMPTHPALMLAPGLGLAWIWLVSQNWTLKWIGPIAVGAITIISGVQAFNDYFVDFASQPELYYAYDVNKLDALNMLADMTDENSVYLSSLWADHATSTFLRGQYGIQSIETSSTLVLPPQGRGAVYAFPDEQVERADDLAEIFPSATITTSFDPQNQPMLHVVHVDSSRLTTWPTDYQPQFELEVGFDDGPILLGMTPQTKDGTIYLFWRSDQKMLRDLTSFVHLLDEQGNKVGQVDRSPGGGTYRTPTWEPGERVIDRYWPTITDTCASSATVRAIVGWYQLADAGRRRSRTDGAGEVALAGRMQLPNRAYAADQLSPAVDQVIELNDLASVVGFTLKEENLEPGAQFSIELIWEGQTDEVPIALWLTRDDDNHELWDGSLSQVPNWEQGRRTCQRFYLRVPIEATAGTYQLRLVSGNAASNNANPDDALATATTLADLSVYESSRQFVVPDEIEPIDAQLSDELEENFILLRGARLDTGSEEDAGNNDSLDITLAWQPASVIYDSYSVFIHALDQNGQIIAQSDAVPGGRQTNLWIPGEIVLDQHTLTGLSVDNYRLVVGLYDPLSGRRMTATDVNGQRLPADAVEISGSQ